jgi:hypothetical protein
MIDRSASVRIDALDLDFTNQTHIVFLPYTLSPAEAEFGDLTAGFGTIQLGL